MLLEPMFGRGKGQPRKRSNIGDCRCGVGQTGEDRDRKRCIELSRKTIWLGTAILDFEETY